MKQGLNHYYQEQLTNLKNLTVEFSFRLTMNLGADGKWTHHHRASLLNIDRTGEENLNDRQTYGYIYK